MDFGSDVSMIDEANFKAMADTIRPTGREVTGRGIGGSAKLTEYEGLDFELPGKDPSGKMQTFICNKPFFKRTRNLIGVDQIWKAYTTVIMGHRDGKMVGRLGGNPDSLKPEPVEDGKNTERPPLRPPPGGQDGKAKPVGGKKVGSYSGTAAPYRPGAGEVSFPFTTFLDAPVWFESLE